MTVLNQHLVNDLSVLIRLGMFDPPESQPYLLINTSVINSAAHQALALRAALEGVCYCYYYYSQKGSTHD